jgi:4'-phosphopantetheinyl transferase
MKSTRANPRPCPAPLLEAFFPVRRRWAGLSCGLHSAESSRMALFALAQLAEAEDRAALLLSGPEQDYLQRFQYPKRRHEWLGGRIAAKAGLLDPPETAAFQRLTILPDKHGRPIVSGLSDSSLSLSISHSGGYAVALALHGSSCGIDLQEVSDKLPELTKYFATPAELELLDSQPQLGNLETRLTMLWTVKEAMKKSLLADQPDIFSGIELKRIHAAANSAWQCACEVRNHPLQTAVVYDFSLYILALSSPEQCRAKS